jgi:probable phosphoglycerate mutase
MKQPDLYILRHGQTEWNLAGRFQGRKNSPLTELGQSHARQQRTILENLTNPPTKRFASPLGRTIQTAELAFGSMDGVILDDRIQEIAFGKWEGATRDQIKSQITSDYETKTWQFQSPDGETFDMIYERVNDFLSEQSTPAIIVTHGVTATVLRGICMGLNQAELLQLSSEQGCVFHVSNGVETILRVDGTK